MNSNNRGKTEQPHSQGCTFRCRFTHTCDAERYRVDKSAMELFIKLLISLIVVFVGAKALHWTWSSQIDPVATFQKYIKKEPKISEMVVTRDPNKLYQGGNAIADITGQVNSVGERIVFEQIANTSGMNTNETFEYQRDTYRVIQIETIIGMKSVASNTGARVLQSVMENVVCEKVN